jgi:hypothetical protein
MAAPDQCAIAADGSLLDASAIVFYNNVDDDTPLPNSMMATTTLLHPFFQSRLAPGEVVSGSCRSGRVSRPSARITDPDNVETPVVMRKRSATMTAPAAASLRGARRTMPTLFVSVRLSLSFLLDLICLILDIASFGPKCQDCLC